MSKIKVLKVIKNGMIARAYGCSRGVGTVPFTMTKEELLECIDKGLCENAVKTEYKGIVSISILDDKQVAEKQKPEKRLDKLWSTDEVHGAQYRAQNYKLDKGDIIVVRDGLTSRCRIGGLMLIYYDHLENMFITKRLTNENKQLIDDVLLLELVKNILHNIEDKDIRKLVASDIMKEIDDYKVLIDNRDDNSSSLKVSLIKYNGKHHKETILYGLEDNYSYNKTNITERHFSVPGVKIFFDKYNRIDTAMCSPSIMEITFSKVRYEGWDLYNNQMESRVNIFIIPEAGIIRVEEATINPLNESYASGFTIFMDFVQQEGRFKNGERYYVCVSKMSGAPVSHIGIRWIIRDGQFNIVAWNTSSFSQDSRPRTTIDISGVSYFGLLDTLVCTEHLHWRKDETQKMSDRVKINKYVAS